MELQAHLKMNTLRTIFKLIVTIICHDNLLKWSNYISTKCKSTLPFSLLKKSCDKHLFSGQVDRGSPYESYVGCRWSIVFVQVYHTRGFFIDIAYFSSIHKSWRSEYFNYIIAIHSMTTTYFFLRCDVQGGP